MMKELYDNYTKTQYDIEKIDEKIRRLESKRSRLYEKSGWINQIVAPLAKKLAEHFNLQYEIYGPFGLGAETSIYLRADMKQSIVEADTWHITLCPAFTDKRPALLYKTGEQTNDYRPGSIGWLNGFNDVLAPLPDEFDEIVKLMRFDKGHAE